MTTVSPKVAISASRKGYEENSILLRIKVKAIMEKTVVGEITEDSALVRRSNGKAFYKVAIYKRSRQNPEKRSSKNERICFVLSLPDAWRAPSIREGQSAEPRHSHRICFGAPLKPQKMHRSVFHRASRHSCQLLRARCSVRMAGSSSRSCAHRNRGTTRSTTTCGRSKRKHRY